MAQTACREDKTKIRVLLCIVFQNSMYPFTPHHFTAFHT